MKWYFLSDNHLLDKDIKSLIKQIAIPSSIGMFFNTMYNVVDTFYVGMISTVAITALSYSFILFFMILSISFGLSTAITVHVGHSLGRKNKTLAKIFVANGMSFVAIVSILLYIFALLFMEPIFELMGAKGESLVLALEYTYIIILGAIPMLLGLGANAVLIAKGDTKSYRNTLILGFFLNLILDPLFIYGYAFIPAFGFEGVAIATVIIQGINFLYITYKLYGTNLFDFSKPKLFLPDIRIYKRILTQAFPSSFNMFVMSLGTMLVTYFVSEYGYKEVAAFGIGYRVEQICLLPMLGLNTAVSSIVANNFGAKNYDRIYEVIKKALIYGYMMSAFGLVFLIIFGKLIVMAFDSDPYVVDISYTYIVVEGFVFFAYITMFITISTLQGIKQPFIIAYISFYRQLLMPFICLYILVQVYMVDIFYVWIALALIIYSAAIYLLFYTKKKLKETLV